MLITLIFSFLLIVGALILVLGSALKMFGYARTPLPAPMPLTPGATSRRGVLLNFLLELFFFRRLLFSSFLTWLFAWCFHIGMVLLLLIHLRFFMQPAWGWVYQLQLVAPLASGLFLFGLLGLLGRRCVVDRVRYISAPSDYLWLLVLLLLGGSGWLMNNVWPVDLFAVTQFARGLVTFNWQPLPLSPWLVIHLSMLCVVLWLFPISKLLHAPAIFFSPTITKRDTSQSGRVVKK